MIDSVLRLRSALVLLTFGLLPQGTAAQTKIFETKVVENVAYYEGPDADRVRHRLDIYLPKGQSDFPVLFFVHGGGWIEGSKNQFGAYAVLGRTFARHGIALVCPNYRLSPAVQHPEHVRDVARAFAWTRRNIGKYGGRPDEIFVGGHSAGGHLSALLATDDTYLKEQGLSLNAIRGALPVSGLFTIPGDRVFWVPFGKDEEVRKQASPIEHARSGLPPFLILLGENDLPCCDLPQADAFCRALKKQGVPAQLLNVKHRNHLSILLKAFDDTDPVTRAILTFISTQVALARLERGGAEVIDALGGFISRYAVIP
jgi:acetyl esterase/lipase